MLVQLVVTEGLPETRTIQLQSPATLIGRDPDCGLCITAEAVSRHHCLLCAEDGYLTVTDLGSAAGTVLNGERIASKQRVRPGDRLTLGPVTFVVEYEPHATGDGPSAASPQVLTIPEPAPPRLAVLLSEDEELPEATLLGLVSGPAPFPEHPELATPAEQWSDFELASEQLPEARLVVPSTDDSTLPPDVALSPPEPATAREPDRAAYEVIAEEADGDFELVPVDAPPPVFPATDETFEEVKLVEIEALAPFVEPEAPAPPPAAPAPPALPSDEEEVHDAIERADCEAAPDEAEAEVEVAVATFASTGLPVGEMLSNGRVAQEEPLSDAAPPPTTAETARSVAVEGGQVAGELARDVAKGVGIGLVRKVLGGLLTALLFERPRRSLAPALDHEDAAEMLTPADLRCFHPVVHLQCPNCRGASWTPADRRGTLLLCPHCRRRMRVPQALFAAGRKQRQPLPAGMRRAIRPRGVPLFGILLGVLLAAAAWLFVSGYWGPLLWQPLQFLLRVSGLPRTWAPGVALGILALVGYVVWKLRFLRRIAAEIDFLPCEPDDFPALDCKALARYTKALESLGFIRIVDYTTATEVKKTMTGFGRLLVHPQRRCYAEINQVFTLQGKAAIPMRCGVQSFLDEGWSLSASDRAPVGARWMMRRRRGLWTSNPQATPADLLAGHLRRRQRMVLDLGLEAPPEVSAEAYFAQVRAEARDRKRTLRWKNLVVGMAESWLFNRAPRYEWMGDYARRRRRDEPTPAKHSS
jgi:hypothetical protein